MSARRRGATRRQSSGVTLIEIAVVMALMAVLAVMTTQLGARWGESTQLAKAQANLQLAFSTAKAVALRNPTNAAPGATAATLCVLAGSFAVVKGSDCTASALAAAYGTYPRDSSLQVQVGGAEPSCLAFDSAGLLIAGGTCTTSTQFTLSLGGSSAQGKPLY